ncbi:hypothetical protein L226DRAFT_506697 [Lentinus tigrinus ALCF2SS1-7]|uniref:Uncharacterized protein n=1 Tax=Lentinus tigrinus ALCF2SS1-6 TaxID=1328759 RepID=A0A5C2SK06_9APHY|nr:hypothetical protein L227DRAFT_546032 [Lentinus tigrinus ALCF2SS1-6]RPD75975.1 hypothetical protein L226DRAFT_506697 [Lentinus tigrinus ALCF2SS1-7]
MVRIYPTAGLFALTALMFTHAAPTRRQLGNLECNIDRGEIVFHVAQLGATVSSLGNATGLVAANSSTDADIQAMQSGATGAGGAIKQILLALINGDNADPSLRDQVGGNLTMVLTALSDLNSTDPTASALLAQANTQLVNAVLAGNGVVNNCK